LIFFGGGDRAFGWLALPQFERKDGLPTIQFFAFQTFFVVFDGMDRAPAFANRKNFTTPANPHKQTPPSRNNARQSRQDGKHFARGTDVVMSGEKLFSEPQVIPDFRTAQVFHCGPPDME